METTNSLELAGHFISVSGSLAVAETRGLRALERSFMDVMANMLLVLDMGVPYGYPRCLEVSIML